MEYHKVVIVGAGVAGLHAAFKLGQLGIRDVVILEALDRIGGRIHTIPVNGDWVELGAQWIHGRGENPLWKFVQENQVRKRKKETNKQTNKQTNHQTNKQTNNQTNERDQVNIAQWLVLNVHFQTTNKRIYMQQ